ncbi:hypothetical protein [Siccibacter turicensis]|uniref:hypothetical protein n=1 Tax=Siccibacter turicensis TaxID=357233 RepID=UPI0023F28193|nr:hypothetical protein [Siccibacter turicensis]
MKVRILVFLSSIAVLLGGTPLIIYLWKYKGEFSSKNADWGNFGSFVGGSTGALLSTLSLLVLIYTLHITINNAKEQFEKQKEYHFSQIQQQETHHLQQLKLQEKLHKEQLDQQKQALEKENYYSRFAANSQLLTQYIDILNKRLEQKEYYLYDNMNNYASFENKQALDLLKKEVEIIFINDKHAGKEAPFEVIKKTKIEYSSELVPLFNILGLISNETDIRTKVNYKSLFLAACHNEQTFWLVCYGMVVSHEFQKIMNENHELLQLPERIKAVFRDYGKL